MMLLMNPVKGAAVTRFQLRDQEKPSNKALTRRELVGAHE